MWMNTLNLRKNREKIRKKKGDKFSRYMAESEKLIEKINDDESIFEFDNYLEYYSQKMKMFNSEIT